MWENADIDWRILACPKNVNFFTKLYKILDLESKNNPDNSWNNQPKGLLAQFSLFFPRFVGIMPMDLIDGLISSFILKPLEASWSP